MCNVITSKVKMKKIGTLSDLHVDENGYIEVLNHLTHIINKKKYSLFLIGGDISSDSQLSIQFIEQLQDGCSTEIIWVAGNHDYWQSNSPNKTMEQTRKEFKKNKNYLQGYRIINSQWAIVGDTGWYDYSFGSSKFTTQQLEKRKYRKRIWQDSIRIEQSKSDIEIHKSQIKTISKAIKKLKDYNIIMMTHMINHPGFKVQKNLSMWDYFNAFLGSDSLFGLTQNKNVKYIISGHVHYRRQIIERGKNYYCACLGTKDEFEFYENNELKWNIENAIQEFKIGD